MCLRFTKNILARRICPAQRLALGGRLNSRFNLKDFSLTIMYREICSEMLMKTLPYDTGN